MVTITHKNQGSIAVIDTILSSPGSNALSFFTGKISIILDNSGNDVVNVNGMFITVVLTI